MFKGGGVVRFAFRVRGMATVDATSGGLENQKVRISEIYMFELNIREKGQVQRMKGTHTCPLIDLAMTLATSINPVKVNSIP